MITLRLLTLSLAIASITLSTTGCQSVPGRKGFAARGSQNDVIHTVRAERDTTARQPVVLQSLQLEESSHDEQTDDTTESLWSRLKPKRIFFPRTDVDSELESTLAPGLGLGDGF